MIRLLLHLSRLLQRAAWWVADRKIRKVLRKYNRPWHMWQGTEDFVGIDFLAEDDWAHPDIESLQNDVNDLCLPYSICVGNVDMEQTKKYFPAAFPPAPLPDSLKITGEITDDNKQGHT